MKKRIETSSLLFFVTPSKSSISWSSDWFMSTKMSADILAKNTPNTPKVWNFNEKRLHLASGIRDYEYLKDTRALDAVHYQCFQPFFPNFFSAFCKKWTPTAACIPRMIRFWISHLNFQVFCLTDKNTYSWKHIGIIKPTLIEGVPKISRLG